MMEPNKILNRFQKRRIWLEIQKPDKGHARKASKMCNHFLKKGESKKKQNILGIIILVLIARLFFLLLFNGNILAKREIPSASLDSEKVDPMEKINQGVISKKIISLEKFKNSSSTEGENEKKENDIYVDLLKGYPMEEMIVEISKKDKIVAAFLISIAKKESNWGIHTPKKDGQECYNYWGYRGRENTTASGYSCFDSPKHAVEVVGGRMERLIEQKIDTPEKMVVWKCGRDCSWDNPVAVRKWISDVNLYYHKLNS